MRPQIFIASSSRAKPLAKQLQLQLRRRDIFSDVYLWYEEQWLPSETLAQYLTRFAKKSDFIATVLTRDDVTSKQGETNLAPRDNCIFEAGLFTGALGLNFMRCFLVSAVEAHALPLDLRGLKSINFNEPPLPEVLQPKDVEACKVAMQKAGDQIEEAVLSMDPPCYPRPVVPLVTKDEILELERHAEVVVVHATQPLERDYPFAVRVMENMRRAVRYSYFFQGDLSCVRFIWEMIQMLSAAGLAENPDRIEPGTSDTKLFLDREENESHVAKNLEFIQQYLSVHFLPNPATIEFCVHHADSVYSAKSYLRYKTDEGHFVEWHKGSAIEAKAIALGIGFQPASRQKGVFRSTNAFDLKVEKGFRDYLEAEIDNYFVPGSKVQNRVKEVCFGRSETNVA
jgi:hypothetical protein